MIINFHKRVRGFEVKKDLNFDFGHRGVEKEKKMEKKNGGEELEGARAENLRA